jgi:hypothetical protein
MKATFVGKEPQNQTRKTRGCKGQPHYWTASDGFVTHRGYSSNSISFNNKNSLGRLPSQCTIKYDIFHLKTEVDLLPGATLKALTFAEPPIIPKTTDAKQITRSKYAI